MAKKKTEDKLNYTAAVRELKSFGPERLYLLWGPEDYLREQYLSQLKKICLPEGEDSFSFHRMNGPELDLNELGDAIDAMPFMTERTLVEIREADLNKIKDHESVIKVLKDIPDYCTVAFVQSARFEPDGRLKIFKSLREIAKELKFTQQSQGALVDWITRRFAAAGKNIDLEAAQRLIFISGDLMNRLIPEIEKIAAYAKGDKVTVNDVNTVAIHIPEADIFEILDNISEKKNNTAAAKLSELLADKNNEPIMIIAVLGMQMRRLYAARLALDRGLGAKYVMDSCNVKFEFLANKVYHAARGFTLSQLKRAVELCAEADYRMKSTADDDMGIVKETVMRIMAGEHDA